MNRHHWFGREIVIFPDKSPSISKRQTITRVDEDAKKLEFLYVAGEVINWRSSFGRQLGSSSKAKYRITMWPSNSTRTGIPKRIEDGLRYLYTSVHCSIIHGNEGWKQPRCLSTVEWINKLWYSCTTEYYLAVKKKEILPFAVWMNIENIMLNARSQTWKATYLWSQLNETSRIGKSIKT